MRKIIIASLLLAGVLVSQELFACECGYVQVPVLPIKQAHQHHHHHNHNNGWVAAR